VGIEAYDLPIFAEIKEIYIIDNIPVIVSQVYRTLNFEKKLFSYQIKKQNELMLLNIEKIVS